ncbi:MAG: hypothetical protein EOP87_12850 [Verrucomicrobiaceae bacterium]|nr:MAG: hypothetical protein EOP87_12850 [Verrucomicrobiaceae bacterium]
MTHSHHHPSASACWTLRLALLTGTLLVMLSTGCSRQQELSPRDQKAAEYFSASPSVVIGRVSNVFYFSKEKDPHGDGEVCELCGPRHLYFITLKVDKTVMGKDWAGTELGCSLYSSSENLELKDTYYMSYDDESKKVYFIEPGNLCPAEEIWERNR